jgi:protein-tyrosine-phosphatase
MAAAITQQLLGPTYRISAAGLHLASTVDSRASKVLREMGIERRRLRRHAVKKLDLAKFDLVIALSESVHRQLKERGAKHLRLWKIDDPYFGQIETYRATATALQKRIARLRKELVGRA